MRKSIILFISLIIAGNGLSQDAKSVQGAFGAVTIDGKIWNQIALRPTVPIWKFGIALDLVFYIDADGNIHDDEWDFSDAEAIKNTIIDKVYYIRYGQKNDPVYFRVGALDRVNLGYGILVNNYTNAIEYPQVRKVGMDFRLKHKNFTAQGFINDFKENIGFSGVRVQTPVLAGIPIGISMVVDRNQYLGLKDSDGDGRPDIVDDFPDEKRWWLDSDNDGLADSDPLEWDIDGDGVTDTLDSNIPGWNTDPYVLDSLILRDPEPLNILKESDPIGAISFDVGYPVMAESKMSLSIYAQVAKLIGETIDPTADSTVSLGSGIIPLGLSGKFGPLRVNLEYRMKPKGNFEFGYWNRTYELERAAMMIDASDQALISTKERNLGRFGPQKGLFASAKVKIGGIFQWKASYQNLQGEMYSSETNDFEEETAQSFYTAFSINKAINRLKHATLFYEQKNVPNPFNFTYSESTIMGYKIGLELGSGMMLNYTFQRTFRLDNSGDLKPINISGIETSFNL